MKADYRVILRREFDAEDGSFLMSLRGEFVWNREAFSRLVNAMEACCRDTEGKETLDRWMAEGFWYLSTFVEGCATHDAFPKDEPAEYYEKAFQRLHDLAYWFFFGESPYLPGSGFEAL
jgi:hypothetical protein